ncbi:MAG: hypothetical protein IJ892_05630 [Prevotella sp.]|nr:hypothetical protein [Prevotella sp.]
MTTFKDTDLREALRRKYSDTPPMPADLSERLVKRMQTTGKSPKRRYWPYITTAIAVAASILLLIVLHLGHGQTEQKPVIAEKMTAPTDSIRPMQHQPATTDATEHPVVAQAAPAKPRARKAMVDRPQKPKADSASAAEELADCIARLEAEMENIDDSVSAAHLEKLIAADARLQQMVYRIVGKQTEQALNEMEKDSTANYINF